MTIDIEIPEDVYERAAALAASRNVPVEEIFVAALAEQLERSKELKAAPNIEPEDHAPLPATEPSK